MLRPRLIPILLLDSRRLVKTRNFKDPVYVGDPLNVIRIFNEKEVDEVIVLDISASKRGVEPDFELLKEMASECFMPITYGGGIHGITQAEKIFALGVEKVCLQSAALRDLQTVQVLSANFGSQAVTVSIDVVRRRGKYHLRQEDSKNGFRGDWLEFLHSAVGAGAGEVLLTAVHQEGSMAGLDLELAALAAEKLDVPLVIHGGVGSIDDVDKGLKAGADAIAVGSFVVFHGPHRAVLITYPHREPKDEF